MTAVVDFGKYELTARLARGGMAETYRAQLKGAAGVTKQVVIKKVLPDYADDKDFIEAFINEAKVSATLSHGNIAQVFDFGEIDGDYFIAMELVDGRSLVEVIFRAAEKGFPTLPEPIATFITIEVLKGLHYAHTKVGDDGKPLNIVHRDISPENVLVAFNGSTKVVDFGVAKAALQGRRETEPGKVKGKFQYLSPEQARGEPLDGRSDVFAVGIILYRMLCGVMPFEGQMHLVMRAIADGNFVPPQVQNPALPPTLAAIIAKSMATDRKDRYASALQMQEALVRNLYREEPTFSEEAIKEWMAWLFRPELEAEGRARVLSKRFETQLAKWDPHGPKVATSQAIRKVKPARPSRAPLWFAGGALLLVAAVGAALLLRPGPVAGGTPKTPTQADEVVFPASIHVDATKHRLALGKGLPELAFEREVDGPIIEFDRQMAQSPLFALTRDAAGRPRVGIVRIRGTTDLGPYQTVQFFDFAPFDAPGRAQPTRTVSAAGRTRSVWSSEVRVGSDSGAWARVKNAKAPLRMTLTADDGNAWQAQGRTAQVVVAWRPSGAHTWEADRAVLTANAPIDVGDAVELAFAFVEPFGGKAAESVTVSFEPLNRRPQATTVDTPPDPPKQIEGALASAQDALDLGDWSAAQQIAAACVTQSPSRADCHQVLAEACEAASDRACALRHYRRAVKFAGPNSEIGQKAAAKLTMLGEKP